MRIRLSHRHTVQIDLTSGDPNVFLRQTNDALDVDSSWSLEGGHIPSAQPVPLEPSPHDKDRLPMAERWKHAIPLNSEPGREEYVH
ncbi:MAG: hypothetical protein VYC44_02400 [Chloroflexota bacterium]|nr:hypothetical protein [Chloroflexota bacterium]MEC9447179.1 hypothetical protein [Chloroflexota bacterium]